MLLVLIHLTKCALPTTQMPFKQTLALVSNRCFLFMIRGRIEAEGYMVNVSDNKKEIVILVLSWLPLLRRAG